MDTQMVINILVGILGTLGGWILNNLKSSIDALGDKVQHIELLVAGTYVKKEELDKTVIALFNKLDKIEEKLDNKLDRKADRITQ